MAELLIELLSEEIPGVSFVRDTVETYMVIIAGFALNNDRGCASNGERRAVVD